MKKTKWIIIYELWEEVFGWDWKVEVYETKEDSEDTYWDLNQQTYVRNLMRIKKTREWYEHE